jgi:nitroreductase
MQQSVVAAAPPALAQLLSRFSVSPLAVAEPGPSAAELDLVFDAALRAPDHGRIRPWSFVLIRGEARSRFGKVLVAALKARDPGASEMMIERERNRPLLAPLTIALGTRLNPQHKVPEIEQTLSVGAAAMNMLNALHMLGYGAMWVTGANAYDAKVAAALGFQPPDRLLGFIMTGTPKDPPAPPSRPDRSAHVTEWQ